MPELGDRRRNDGVLEIYDGAQWVRAPGPLRPPRPAVRPHEELDAPVGDVDEDPDQ